MHAVYSKAKISRAKISAPVTINHCLLAVHCAKKLAAALLIHGTIIWEEPVGSKVEPVQSLINQASARVSLVESLAVVAATKTILGPS